MGFNISSSFKAVVAFAGLAVAPAAEVNKPAPAASTKVVAHDSFQASGGNSTGRLLAHRADSQPPIPIGQSTDHLHNYFSQASRV